MLIESLVTVQVKDSGYEFEEGRKKSPFQNISKPPLRKRVNVEIQAFISNEVGSLSNLIGNCTGQTPLVDLTIFCPLFFESRSLHDLVLCLSISKLL